MDKWFKAVTKLVILTIFAVRPTDFVEAATIDKPQSQSVSAVENVTANLNMTIEYLGVGGYLIIYDSYKLLIAPSFTNPGYTALAQSLVSNDLQADNKLIETHFPSAGHDNPKSPKTNVGAILVGHAHYDHLLDVPYIMKNYTLDAKAYGSNTMKSILRAKGINQQKIVALNHFVNDNQSYNEKNWHYVSDNRIRFMAIKSNHAPLIGQMMFADGHYNGDMIEQELDVNGWKRGETFAYVIDLLDNNKNVVFRMHYADAASAPPNGFLPQAMLQDKPVDLAILCLAGFSKVAQYPQGIMKHLQPKSVIVGHWEHFFDNQGKPPSPVDGSDQAVFIELLQATLPKGANWVMPKPFFMVELR